jgi:hypothetical protein
MPEESKDPTLANKLDELLNEYVAKRKLDNAGDLYSLDAGQKMSLTADLRITAIH